jgi:hypothetical protein
MEIMKALSPSSISVFALSSCAALVTSSAAFADVLLQKAPPLTVEQAPAYPENLARYHLGARLEASSQKNPIQGLQLSSKAEDKNTAEAALLCDDPTTGYLLPKGVSTLLISLPNIEHVESISFLNSDAKGDLTIATSSAKLTATSPQWHSADVKPDLAAGTVKATVGPTDAKYVKLTFNVTEPGRIAGLGVYSTPAVSDFTMPRPRKASFDEGSETFALITYNFTDIHTKARALYVSSGGDLKKANDMIDDQLATSYNFAADDAAPTAVIDLGKSCTLRRLSAVYAPRQGSVDFYVVDSLPVKQDAETAEFSTPEVQTVANTSSAVATEAVDLPKTLKITDEAFSKMKPVGSVTNSGSEGRASVDFPATTGRYVLVKWNPASQQDGAFSVAEVAAFGASKRSGNSVASDGKRTMDGKQLADGKDILDNKDIPAEGPPAPAEGPPGAPPGLPQPPPFTFIPQVPPVSD